jgi:hypothetical protein
MRQNFRTCRLDSEVGSKSTPVSRKSTQTVHSIRGATMNELIEGVKENRENHDDDG